MGFVGDKDVWKDFTKTVRRLKNSNVVVCAVHLKPNKIKIHKTNELDIFLNNRTIRNGVKVEQLSKAGIKKIRFEKSIDLHGCTREIDGILATFCARCILNNIHDISIIIGKGRGIVKSATEIWLKLHPEFVIGFFEIKDLMGESGAFGVKLRKDFSTRANKKATIQNQDRGKH